MVVVMLSMRIGHFSLRLPVRFSAPAVFAVLAEKRMPPSPSLHSAPPAIAGTLFSIGRCRSTSAARLLRRVGGLCRLCLVDRKERVRQRHRADAVEVVVARHRRVDVEADRHVDALAGRQRLLLEAEALDLLEMN